MAPEIDCGRFPAKRLVGDALQVEADIFSDGHDALAATLLYRPEDSGSWQETPMRHLGNDRWRGSFDLPSEGRYLYTIAGWRDLFATWRDEVGKKVSAGQDVGPELREGVALLTSAAGQDASGSEAGSGALAGLAVELSTLTESGREAELLDRLMHEETGILYRRHGPRSHLTRYDKQLVVQADRPRAGFGAWYELSARSQSGDPRRHGTFDDVIGRLGYIRDLGFDVLYLLPIHPIGQTNRKGRNNSLTAGPEDPGSPYAIGSPEGGHDAIHPQLGTFADFDRLVAAAREHGLEIALDFAVQCSPDHPWIRDHPEWFDWRPDGTLRFAENPPKKYEDIVNVHFYRDAFPSIWFALRDVVLFWAKRKIRIFRVDNPHTKPMPFWEWLIRDVQRKYPDIILLSEAFTRPKVMKRLAKLGFAQSYTYFTWRNSKQELIDYVTELTKDECREYMRPNFFTNTPDINPYYLQSGERAGFQVRLVLAATLAGSYGIYNGFELCEAAAIPGKEEYLNSEKYEIRAWDWDRPGHIREDIRLMNRLRRQHAALRAPWNISFYNVWNDNILYYGRMTDDKSNFLLFAVNLDPHAPQGAHFEVPLWEFGLPDEASIGVEDLVTGRQFAWHGKVQHMWLDPADRPYRAWRLLPPGDE